MVYGGGIKARYVKVLRDALIIPVEWSFPNQAKMNRRQLGDQAHKEAAQVLNKAKGLDGNPHPATPKKCR